MFWLFNSDLSKFNSWQTVSSNTSTLELLNIMKSGRTDVWKIKSIEEKPGEAISTPISYPVIICAFIHPASRTKILLWRVLYLSSWLGNPQFDKMCMFVWDVSDNNDNTNILFSITNLHNFIYLNTIITIAQFMFIRRMLRNLSYQVPTNNGLLTTRIRKCQSPSRTHENFQICFPSHFHWWIQSTAGSGSVSSRLAIPRFLTPGISWLTSWLIATSTRMSIFMAGTTMSIVLHRLFPSAQRNIHRASFARSSFAMCRTTGHYGRRVLHGRLNRLLKWQLDREVGCLHRSRSTSHHLHTLQRSFQLLYLSTQVISVTSNHWHGTFWIQSSNSLFSTTSVP